MIVNTNMIKEILLYRVINISLKYLYKVNLFIYNRKYFIQLILLS